MVQMLSKKEEDPRGLARRGPDRDRRSQRSRGRCGRDTMRCGRRRHRRRRVIARPFGGLRSLEIKYSSSAPNGMGLRRSLLQMMIIIGTREKGEETVGLGQRQQQLDRDETSRLLCRSVNGVARSHFH